MVERDKTTIRAKVYGCIAVLCISLTSLLPQTASAARSPAPGAARNGHSAPLSALKKLLKEPFSYTSENRSDPFMPFISEQIMRAQERKEAKSLTGMQLFEPGQLNLVAILFRGNRALAMVQDSTGKGYVIKKGTKIGRRGEVSKILPNAVVIKEWFLGSNGKKLYRDNEMVLRKEGGKE